MFEDDTNNRCEDQTNPNRSNIGVDFEGEKGRM